MKRALGPVLGMLLAVTLAAAGCEFAARERHVFDWSRDARNSLAPASTAVLALLDGPLRIEIMVAPHAPVARPIGEFFARYQRHKSDTTITFVDPERELDRLRRRGASAGEILLEHGGRHARLSRVDEHSTTLALARLARGGERYVTFLAANGERRIAREANHDLSRLARDLEARGLALHEYVLGTHEDIPHNTALLVIASPAVAYTASELAAILRHVARGGNLLWLAEPDQPAALEDLARALGVVFLPGTIVDPTGLTKLGNAVYAVAQEFTAHTVVDGFNQTLALPYAAALAPAPNLDWQAAILTRTGAQAWTETASLEGQVGFDEGHEIQGELVLALALSKARDDGSTQRVVVVGDGDFLSNAFVDNLGHRAFGRRLFEWLAEDDALIDIDVRTVPDDRLDLAMWQRVTLFVFFVVLLPGALALNGLLYARRRRRA